MKWFLWWPWGWNSEKWPRKSKSHVFWCFSLQVMQVRSKSKSKRKCGSVWFPNQNPFSDFCESQKKAETEARKSSVKLRRHVFIESFCLDFDLYDPKSFNNSDWKVLFNRAALRPWQCSWCPFRCTRSLAMSRLIIQALIVSASAPKGLKEIQGVRKGGEIRSICYYMCILYIIKICVCTSST